MSFLCKYQDALGVPNKGIHSYRIFGTAAVDLGLTVLLAYVTARYILNDASFVTLLTVLVMWLLIGELAHYAFCVETAWINTFKTFFMIT